MKAAWRHVRGLWSRSGEAGASIIEYGLVVAFIALVAVSGTSVLGARLAAGFEGATQALIGMGSGEPVGDDGQAQATAEAQGSDEGATAMATKGKSAVTPGLGKGAGGGRDR